MNSEIIRYRMLLFSGILGFPAWGLVLEKLDASQNDPIWIRLLVAVCLAACLGASYKVKNKQKFIETMFILGGWMMLLHFVWIAFQSHFSYSMFCGFLIMLSCLLNVFPTKLSTWALAIAAAMSGIVIALIPGEWIVSPLLVNFSLWTTIVVSLSANLTRINQLQSLTAMQTQMDLLFENMKEGILVFDPMGKVKMANPMACQFFGLARNQILGRELSDALFLNERNRLASVDDLPYVQARIQQQEVRDCVLGLQRPDGGTLWLKLSAVPILPATNSNTSILLTMTDLTDLKRSQRVSFERQARLEASAKLTALGEMAAGVAHEINNPLAIILGRVYMLQKTLQTGRNLETVDASFSKIIQTVGRIKTIVQSLQDFSSGGEPDPFQITHLQDIVNESLETCRERLSEKQIQIQLDLETNLKFECRAHQISRCLTNLILNSCDAIETQSDRWIRIWARSAHQSLVLTISDSGPGIPVEIQNRLMQPFFTTKAPGVGTGLGLSVARGLIHSHLGRIWLDSSAAHTSFVIELPLAQIHTKKTG